MGDISLPQEQDYFRVQFANGLYRNRMSLEQVEEISQDPVPPIVKVEHVEVKVHVTDWSSCFVEVPDEQWGVHETHCCRKHGCKYGKSRCPVSTGKVKQAYACEECGYEDMDGNWGPTYG